MQAQRACKQRCHDVSQPGAPARSGAQEGGAGSGARRISKTLLLMRWQTTRWLLGGGPLQSYPRQSTVGVGSRVQAPLNTRAPCLLPAYLISWCKVSQSRSGRSGLCSVSSIALSHA